MKTPLQDFVCLAESDFGVVDGVGQKTLQRLRNQPDHSFGSATLGEYASSLWATLSKSSNSVFVNKKDKLLDWLAKEAEIKRKDLKDVAAFSGAICKLAEIQGCLASRKRKAIPKTITAFGSYLSGVARECSELVTRGIPMASDTRDTSLPLADVYVELETQTPKPAPPDAERVSRAEYLSALEAVLESAGRRVVITGDPGSGKSTFIQFITLWLADEHSDQLEGQKILRDLKMPARFENVQLVPLRIILREFARWLPEDSDGSSKDVTDYLLRKLNEGSYTGAAAALESCLKNGEALVLFDGLDEVPQRQLARIRAAILAFANGGHAACRIVVTCRTRSYEQEEFALKGFPKHHAIAPLSSSLQTRFIHAWYCALENAREQFRGEGTACAKSLLDAIRNDPSERLREMAGNPFFLTAMAGLHRPDEPLPNTSAALMEKLVESVLRETRRTGQEKGGGQSSRRDVPELAEVLRPAGSHGFDSLRIALESVAFKARKERAVSANGIRSKSGDRDISENLLNGELVGIGPLISPQAVIEALRHRAGILQSTTLGGLEFAYRFEEFLAGCHLAKQADSEKTFHQRAWELYQQQGDFACQVVVWASGYKAHVIRGREHPDVRALVEFLRRSAQQSPGEHLATLELAAAIAIDARMEQWPPNLDSGAASEVAELRRVLESVRDSKTTLPIRARAKAASTIGRLGDPRPGVGVKLRGQNSTPAECPDFFWCGPNPNEREKPFPAGEFWMGGDPHAYVSSPKPFRCTRIGRPFFMARYPVTVAQYRLFILNDGYENSKFWTESGLKWLSGQGSQFVHEILRKEYLSSAFPIGGPKDYQTGFQTPNHPRVGVSWFEASAYCNWLNLTFSTEELGLPGQRWTIRLATDAEWERAARWPNSIDGGKSFPWGNESADAELIRRCNGDKTDLKQTSAVGLFSPEGDSGAGVADLSGNCWEWCQSVHAGLQNSKLQAAYNASQDLDSSTRDDPCVLRGGSWANLDPRDLRAASRLRLYPGIRDYGIGFRVVCVGESPKAETEVDGVMPDGKTSCPAGAKMPSLTPSATPRVRGEKTRCGPWPVGAVRMRNAESHGPFGVRFPDGGSFSSCRSHPPVIRPASSMRPITWINCCWLIQRCSWTSRQRTRRSSS